MKLQELLEKLKYILQIDEQLKAYLYKNRIEIIDFTSGYEIPEQDIKAEDFYGRAVDLILDDDFVITCIDDHMFSLYTTANKEMVIQLVSLIGTQINDYKSYEKLPSIKEQSCITV